MMNWNNKKNRINIWKKDAPRTLANCFKNGGYQRGNISQSGATRFRFLPFYTHKQDRNENKNHTKNPQIPQKHNVNFKNQKKHHDRRKKKLKHHNYFATSIVRSHFSLLATCEMTPLCLSPHIPIFFLETFH